MKTIALAIVTLAVLSGCGTTTFKHPNGGVNYNTDFQACQYEAIKHGHVAMWGTGVGAGIEEGMRKREITIACMQSKGYTI